MARFTPRRITERDDLSVPRGAVPMGGRFDTDAFGRISEGIARFLGTGRYLVGQTVFVIGWIIINVVAGVNHWDPYPFILLNLAFSTQAAYAAPLILLAQNRQDDRDRANIERDREVAARTQADTEYLARELASVRLALDDVVTREDLEESIERMVKLLADRPASNGAAPTGERQRYNALAACAVRRCPAGATRPGNHGLTEPGGVSSLFVTQAPAFSVVADIAITKGETPAGDRTWLSFPDGTSRRAVVHVIHDLPHLVVESVFGLGDGLWGTLARGGFENAARALGRRHSRIRLVTDAPLDDLGEETWPAHVVAKAAVNAVVNRWGDGPGTPDGVRDRMRGHSPEAADVADRLDDETILVAINGVRRLYREWSALPVGGTLRLTWPLHDSWLRQA